MCAQKHLRPSFPTSKGVSQNFAGEVHYTYMYLRLYIHVSIIIHTCTYNQLTVLSFETPPVESGQNKCRDGSPSLSSRLTELQKIRKKAHL